MTDAKTLCRTDVGALLAAVLKNIGRVAAPVFTRERHRLEWLDEPRRFSLPEVNTVNSVKEFFFPSSEPFLRYRQAGRTVEIAPAHDSAIAPFVVFGVRPCDAASLKIMDKVFNWDSTDRSWQARRDAATVVVAACANADRYCFCTAVGLAPDARAGADVILLPASAGAWVVDALTPKGDAFLREYAGFLKSGPPVAPALAAVAPRVSVEAAARWLQCNFQSPLWDLSSSRCLGCGVCTYCCPTCHCFDIQDEADAGSGARFRTWDSCSFALFTKHASGHNPRADRPSRWRQRIMHKFCYYPERFGILSCTGCGRCGRLCPVDLGVEETLRAITEDAT